MTHDTNAVGQRVSEVLNTLKNLKQITGDKDISVKLGYRSSASITEIKKGRATPSTEFLNLLEKDYRVSRKYILEGEGPKFLSEEGISLSGELPDLVAKGITERTAMMAAITYLTEKIIELESRITGRPFSDVSLETRRKMQEYTELALEKLR